MAKKATLKKPVAKKPAGANKKPAPAPGTKVAPPKSIAKPASKPQAKPGPKPTAQPPVKAVSKPAPQNMPPPPPVASAPPSVPAVATPEPVETVPYCLPKTVPLSVSVQTSQGMAANGNTHPANLLVIVTCAGWPVTELDKNHFTLMEHFEVPGQVAPFSNSISSFRNAGTGAYLLQTKPINGAPWKTGHHLGQLLVSNSEDQQGQAAFKLIVR
ncbi:hypothetical protein GCM10023213_02340 [Prosthecobacter algae]|uniref:Uncharacterized protein n=1 Tax=Prosthecobacter algae TaxID=1144682 RepID=A0ABP9NSB9_9BACT